MVSSEMRQQVLSLPGTLPVYGSLQIFGQKFVIVFKLFLKVFRTLRMRQWWGESGLSEQSLCKKQVINGIKAGLTESLVNEILLVVMILFSESSDE